ncbi:Pimeloyl-ACP methyl ester carboxylesterase [Actinopolymorpha cephalotaxi]|uniref:Pimeloyl-ACP methyl ester carboxylesterase n=1 Tax=Actinopolymorpha cephalotaxi TaxID=504797 RepID=A0A1I3C7Y2_9ACTN|nr:epoxide hydrolase family protein [Actinopolymorpha cephalotaxi]NYH86838.1 pimeloyl-ACP methyl ester carboxylesterase [Actinopolymorpha cephalotaxi]SFH70436.1 Pimeloyl-ACP methyl ester carboxylesterase [Actinopolymorpha cephalotaxi]
MIEPFTIEISQSALDDLRRRLARTRWPEPEPVGDWSQGVPLRQLQELCAYWADGYDWRATERRLNAIPQFRTEIDGVQIHFLHVRSPRPDATPLVLTHGWPGSFCEFEQAIGPLTDPERHGGDPADAFDVVVPSLPGYAFSGTPSTTAWGIHRIARAWCELMTRLGYDRFVAAGSDWGTSISTSIALQRPDRLLGLHLVPPLAAPDRDAPDLTDAERSALDDLDERTRTGSGYSAMHSTRPQTVGYGLVDSPSGLAGWIGEKLWLWADRSSGGLTRDQMLDDLSIYWFTGTAASSARLYWESIDEVAPWFTSATADTIAVPTGASVFPAEAPRPSRRWAERRFTNIVHWSEPPRGGHFGAWEQPGLFVADVRATARALRRTS